MNQLELYYNQPLKSSKFIPRKYEIISPKTLIIGAISSGKTALVYEFLSHYKSEERLYVNLDDLRIDRALLLANLKEFLEKNTQIKVLAVENLQATDLINLSFLKGATLENIILTSKEFSLTIDGFARINLNYLDYEEFILFFKKNLDQDLLFSYFLAHGNEIASAFLDSSEVTAHLQQLLKANLSEQSIAILKECAPKCHDVLSTFGIYKNLKEQMKISKDSVYNAVTSLNENGFIELVPNLDESSTSKKLYFTNFALRNALYLKKDFLAVFANVVFCELLKFKDEIYYTKEIDFFLNKRKIAIICVPFSAPEIIFLKFKKLHASLKELGVSKLQIISVANQAELSFEGIKCEILPFSRWSLGL
ncbi:ATP-binding protein [Campylobacter concisus]|uniref:ATP-binding protein n=1 Tax=Campylobacter concisus TaxID=199 RepID=UPI000CD8BD84|nr:ATP-binding protein [Campylobacter concisus]